MASGNSLLSFGPYHNEPPATGYALLDTRNQQPCLDFPATGTPTAVFSGVLPRHYGGGGITATVGWAASAAVTGTVVWELSFERHQDDVDDLDTDSFATAKSVTATTASVAGELAYDDVAFTNGAEIDNLAIGEHFRLKVVRNAGTVVGDGELFFVALRET